MTIKSKTFMLLVGIISFGLLLVGGTYAFLSFSATVTNATYNGTTECFLVDYGAVVSTEGLPISGTLFQSSEPKAGLLSTVTMKINNNCNVNGKGTIHLTVDATAKSDSSTDLRLIGDAHCKNSETGRTIRCAITDTSADLKNNKTNFWSNCSTANSFAVTSSNCTSVNNGVWVSDNATPPLKYAVYNSSGTMVSSGYVNKTGDIPVYSDFTLSKTTQTFSVYIWLDGNMADNTYVDMPFKGFLHATAIQTE